MISIITVTYNSAASLQRTIDSVLAQSYQDWQHVIVDGGSKDDTVEIVRRNESRYKGRLVWLSEPDKGIYDAINKGIRLSTGDIIGVLNSDDTYADDKVLTRLSETFAAEQCDICYGDLVYCKHDGSVLRHWRSNSFNRRLLALGWMPAHPTLYCTREVYQREGDYDDWFRISADYDFMLRILQRDYRVSYIPQILVRMSVGGASNKDARAMLSKSTEDLLALRKNHVGWGVLTLLCKNLQKLGQFIH